MAQGNAKNSSQPNERNLFAIENETAASFIKKLQKDSEQFIGIRERDEDLLISGAFVQEIIMVPRITKIPRSAEILEGVINLRGQIVPVFSLSKIIRGNSDHSETAKRIIVLSLDMFILGLLVDSISFVTTLMQSALEDPLIPSDDPFMSLISHVAKTNGKVYGVLDIKKLIFKATQGQINFE